MIMLKQTLFLTFCSFIALVFYRFYQPITPESSSFVFRRLRRVGCFNMTRPRSTNSLRLTDHQRCAQRYTILTSREPLCQMAGQKFQNYFCSSALQFSNQKKNNSNLGDISRASPFGLITGPFSCPKTSTQQGAVLGHRTTGVERVKVEGEPGQQSQSITTNRLTEFLIDKELNPVFSYEDLQLDEVRKKISFETRNLSGVYMVLNKVTLDFYIGSASTGKFYSRFYRHLISFNGSKIVKYAVRKYKLTSFAFLILKLFPEIVTKENNNKLIALEDFYLKTMLPNYNILTEAGSSFGYKHTEITRLNMSKNYSQARKE